MIEQQELSLEQIEASPIDKDLVLLLKGVLRGASHLVADGQQLEAILFMLTPQGNFIVPLAHMHDDAEKEDTVRFIRDALRETNATAYMTVMEMWAIEPDPGESMESIMQVRPSKSDRRFELVTIGGYTKTGKALSAHYEIIRDENGSRLAEKTRWLTTEEQEGRFGENLFKPIGESE